MNKLLEVFRAGYEVRFAVDLDHYSELRARMNIGSDDALLSRACRFLRGRRDATLTQNHFRLRQVAVGFDERLLAFHHTCACLIAQLFYECRGDFRHVICLLVL
jgi:hypothetical protein